MRSYAERRTPANSRTSASGRTGYDMAVNAAAGGRASPLSRRAITSSPDLGRLGAGAPVGVRSRKIGDADEEELILVGPFDDEGVATHRRSLFLTQIVVFTMFAHVGLPWPLR